jgi:hypothetical protein
MNNTRNPLDLVGRDLICCLLVVQLEKYESLPVFEQIRSTEALKALLDGAGAGVPGVDIALTVIRDDGGTLCFLGDAKACFASADRLRETASESAVLPLKIGINLGPARFSRNESDQLEVAGDGLRDAIATMRECQPGEILVSRPFFEVLARFAPGYATLMRYKGLSENDDVPLEMYRFGTATARPEDTVPADNATRNSQAAVMGTPFDAQTADAASGMLGTKMTRARLIRFGYVGFAILGVSAVAYLASINPEVTPGVAVARVQQAAPTARAPAPEALIAAAPAAAAHTQSVAPAIAPAPLAAQPAQAPPVAVVHPKPSETQAAAAAPGVIETEEEIETATQEIAGPEAAEPDLAEAKASETEESSIPVQGENTDELTPLQAEAGQPAPAPANAPTKARSPRKGGKVQLAVRPWGEVYVDGKKVGITPPLKNLRMKPGKHLITVRNAKLPSVEREVQVGANAPFVFVHDFH